MSRPLVRELRGQISRLRLHHHISRRRIGTQPQFQPVRIWGPALFCLSTGLTIYSTLASYEIYSEAKQYEKATNGTRPSTYEDLFEFTQHVPEKRAPPPPQTMLDAFRNLPEPDKVGIGLIAANVAMYAAVAAPRFGDFALQHLVHSPVSKKNYPMFTCMFLHASVPHLAMNMYCLYNFGSAVAYSPTFAASGAHLAAFYLSSGLLASMGAQIEASLAPARRRNIGVGASGAIMALVGFFATRNPDAQVGIILLPGRVDASTALGLIVAFETYGAVFGIPRLNWGHSVHLAGLAVGAAYAHWNPQGHFWLACKFVAFNNLRWWNVV